MSWTLSAEARLGETSTIRRYVWPSGLRVVLLSDPSAPVFSYQTWFRVGSRHEQPGQTGMAHFFEHLMFGETETFPTGEFDRRIEETGGDNNAATWNDWTFYRTSLPAKDLELAARLESDRMQRLVLESEQIETERDVIISERKERVEDDVDGFLDEQLSALAFTQHPYRWPTIGWMEDIRALDKAAIQRFYRTYYAPNNATIVVVGAMAEDHVLDVIARHYGHIPPASLPVETPVVEPEQVEERRKDFAKPVTAERLLMSYRVPGQGHPDWAVTEFIASILCGGPSSRLYRRLIVDTEIATSVSCGVPPFRDPCLFRFAVNLTREHGADEAIREIDAILSDLMTRPVDQDELMKVKNCVETDFWSSLEDCDGKAEALGHYESTLGDFRQLFRTAERLAAVSAGDVQRAAATYFQPGRRSIVVARPASSTGQDRGPESTP
jgi:zinc protease